MSLPWRGPWQPFGRYEPGDIVEHQGSVFKALRAITALTPGVLTSDQCKNWQYVCRTDEIDWNAAGKMKLADDQLAIKNQNGVWHFNTELDRQIVQSYGIPPAQVGLDPDADRPFVRYDPQATLRSANQIGISQDEADELRRQLQEALQDRMKEQVQYADLKRGYDILWREKYARTEKPVDIGPLPKETRIGDSMRNKYIEHLSVMLSDGVLALDEFTERMDKAAVAKYERELKELVTDLPPMSALTGLGISKEFTQTAKRKPKVSSSKVVLAGVWSAAVVAWLILLLITVIV